MTLRAVAPAENVLRVGEDIQLGDHVLPSGHVLRPQDLGGLIEAYEDIARRFELDLSILEENED